MQMAICLRLISWLKNNKMELTKEKKDKTLKP